MDVIDLIPREEQHLPVEAASSEPEQEDMTEAGEETASPPLTSGTPHPSQISNSVPWRSTRPTRRLTYDSLGQSSYRPQLMVNTVDTLIYQKCKSLGPHATHTHSIRESWIPRVTKGVLWDMIKTVQRIWYIIQTQISYKNTDL